MNKPITKRGLTLLETLIALVLVLALGALIFPALMDSLDERTFESAADVTNDQLMMARAHAQATGSPVEVTYRADTAQVQVRLFAPWLTGLPTLPMQATGAAHEFSAMGPLAPLADEKSDAVPVIEESWACRALGRGVRMSSRPPASTDDSTSLRDADSYSSDDRQSWNDLGKGQDIRLAVFMPDGSALLGDPVWLNDDKGRCGMLSVNPWSGLPFFQRFADVGDQALAQSDTSKSSGDGLEDDGSFGSTKATAAADQNRRGHARKTPRPATVEPDDDTVGSQ